MQAVLDPLGMPLATDVVSGECADDPLYVPCIARVQQSLGRCGLLFVGDCKMAAHATRAFIALAGDYYLCPLPQVQLAEGELDEALDRVWSGEQALTSVFREQEQGKPQLIAQGYEYEVPMSVEVEGSGRNGRAPPGGASVRHAEAAEAALRAPVAKAKAHVEALNLAAEVANALKRSRRYARPSPRLSSITASRTFCGCATTSTHAQQVRA